MKTKIILLFVVSISMLIFSGCTKTKSDKIIVAVSIVPQETFVKEIAGDLVDVVTMIPPGYSESNYQPTSKQMTNLSDASIYFSIGVPAEEANILPKVTDFNSNITIIKLNDIVGEVYQHRYFSDEEYHEEDEHEEDEHDHSGRDPHIWLSPKRVKVMINSIRDELVKLDPDNKLTYEKNASDFIEELDQVDNEIKETLKNLSQVSFIMYHPSFGYFADDYGLNMIAIEEDGKAATSKKIQQVIEFAKQENIKYVFYQEEFDSNQAEMIANEIDGVTIKVRPLAIDYIENLREINEKLKETLK